MTVSVANQTKWRNKLISFHLEKLRTDPMFGVDYVQNHWTYCVAGLFFRDAENRKGFPSKYFTAHSSGMLEYSGVSINNSAYSELFGAQFKADWLDGGNDTSASGRFAYIRHVLRMADACGVQTLGLAMDSVIGNVEDIEASDYNSPSGVKYIRDDIADLERQLAARKADLAQWVKTTEPQRTRLKNLVVF